jgi:ADP-ribose pyrophosphatase YjhB (NUDIX family)
LTIVRPGWGSRHPALASLLDRCAPAVSVDASWADGAVPLRMRAQLDVDACASLPDDLITSVRCLVRVGDGLLVCETADGWHPWPGGRREPGETVAETACREVHEETGWRLDPSSLVLVGWLHIEFFNEVPPDHPYPHPDIVQLVFTGRATTQDDAPGGEWRDTEGWEQRTRVASLAEAMALIEPRTGEGPFLALLAD